MAEFGHRANRTAQREGRIVPASARQGGIAAARQRAGAPVTGSVSRDEGLRAYMLGVYNLMMLGVAFSGAIMLALLVRPDLLRLLAGNPLFPLAIFAGTFGLSFFSRTIVESRNPVLGHVFFWTYAALWGMGLAPMMAIIATAGQIEIIARAFFIAASMFGAASLYGYTTRNDLSGWGPVLCMLCWGLLAATVLNLVVFKTPMLGLILCYGTVILFTVVTAFETQLIKDMYDTADDAAGFAAKSIYGAFELYGSFMMIFSRLVRILWSLYEEVG